jgi:uncharacterized protein with PIN domain
MARHSEEHTTRNEDEYFARENAELIKQMRSKLDADRLQQHFMKCPKCGADLEERTHGEVKLDVCPECHGMWLDAGEMDLMHQISKNPASRIMDDVLNVFRRRK